MTFYSQLTGEGAAAAAVAAVRTWLDLEKGKWSNAARYQVQSEVASMDPVTGEVVNVFVVPAPAVVLGTSVTDVMPAGVQVIAQLQTGQYAGGRQIRGRIFLPALTESSFASSGTVDTGVINDLVTSIGNLANDADLVVWSRKNGAAVPVASVSVPFTVGFLKSRRL